MVSYQGIKTGLIKRIASSINPVHNRDNDRLVHLTGVN